MRDLKGLWRFPGDFLQTFFKWYGATLVIAANYTARPAQPRGCPTPREPCPLGSQPAATSIQVWPKDFAPLGGRLRMR
jgi:hypothetical protein